MNDDRNRGRFEGGTHSWTTAVAHQNPRNLAIAIILMTALLAFEIFNYDTTKFALTDLLGHVTFLGLSWAGILSFAFCAIDFAGLVRIFTPGDLANESKEVWYLMGAWLLGATMNAIMTWYAVSLTLTQRPVTSGVLTPEQLMTYVPIFVATLVWLTRILFIGSLSVAGETLFNPQPRATTGRASRPQPAVQARPQRPTAQPLRQATPAPRPRRSVPVPKPAPAEVVYEDIDEPVFEAPASRPVSRVQRPSGGLPARTPLPMSAKGKR